MKVCLIIALVVLNLIVITSVAAQGISRSTGVGMQIGFWNLTDHPTQISFSGFTDSPTVHIGGVGVWFNFFSRAYKNLFLEFKIGAFGSLDAENVDIENETAEIESHAIIPLLFGVRYDVFSTRIPSAIQPYLTLGVGRYWTTTVADQLLQDVIIESKIFHGLYSGGGINIVLASWFALNFDLRYHFIDYKVEQGYSGLEFDMGCNFMWGSKREIFKIKDIKLVVSDIYPAYYQFYNMYPLALVTIKNVASHPIEVNIRSQIERYSERPRETGFVSIPKGKEQDIPITIIFGPRLMEISQNKPAVLDMEIEVRAGNTVKKTVSAQLIVHNRNAWNGDVDKLSVFVTPDNEEIMQLSRKLNSARSDSNNSNFFKAQAIYKELQKMGIHYTSDPNIPFYKDDRVQFAIETLQLKSGDCDDLVVLFASLLESLGINTAFVEVRDPQKEIAHLYLLFDSGLTPDMGHQLSANEKRFVIRESVNKQKTLWIPLETTLIDKGFEESWKYGATSYLQEVILRNGLNDGWIKIIDVE